MKQIWDELRCAIVELLFNVQLWIVPKDSTEGYLLRMSVKYYYAELAKFMGALRE